MDIIYYRHKFERRCAPGPDILPSDNLLIRGEFLYIVNIISAGCDRKKADQKTSFTSIRPLAVCRLPPRGSVYTAIRLPDNAVSAVVYTAEPIAADDRY